MRVEKGCCVVVETGEDVNAGDIFTFAFVNDCESEFGDANGNKTAHVRLPGMKKSEWLNANQITAHLASAN